MKIESIDPAAKAKIIREVKAQVANLNLMEVRPVLLSSLPFSLAYFFVVIYFLLPTSHSLRRISSNLHPRSRTGRFPGSLSLVVFVFFGSHGLERKRRKGSLGHKEGGQGRITNGSNNQ